MWKDFQISSKIHSCAQGSMLEARPCSRVNWLLGSSVLHKILRASPAIERILITKHVRCTCLWVHFKGITKLMNIQLPQSDELKIMGNKNLFSYHTHMIINKPSVRFTGITAVMQE